MRKIIFTVAVCLFITAVLLVIGFCDFPLKALTLSLVSTAMFIGFAFLLRAVNPKMSARRFFFFARYPVRRHRGYFLEYGRYCFWNVFA